MGETASFGVTGMTCEHCVAAVTARLRELDGVGDVAVELVPDGASTVTVSSAQPLDGRVVRSAVAAAGYRMAR